MKEVTFTELVDFMRRNPDMEVNMGNSMRTPDCGCLMIEFAKDKGWPCSVVGAYSFIEGNKPKPFAQLEDKIQNLFIPQQEECIFDQPKQTMSDLLKLVKPEYYTP